MNPRRDPTPVTLVQVDRRRVLWQGDGAYAVEPILYGLDQEFRRLSIRRKRRVGT